jgi:hypothetical protein
MLPVMNLTSLQPLPQRDAGIGGLGAVIFPHFAQGESWATEIIMANTSASPMTVRADFYGQDGNPLTVRLNNDSRSSFSSIAIAPGGVTVLAPRDPNGNSRF